jgi:[acyl-carrier-protein] S-malonyltransferase
MSDNSRIIYVFPGQGSQYQGIGSDLYERYESARKIYRRASEVLGYDIAELSFHGPEDKITLTRYTQPVLVTHHIACLEVFKELSVKGGTVTPYATAGHSLVEYSALVAAGALSFEQALRLVQKRGEFMSEYGAGEMLALPFELATAQPLAEKYFCAVAGCNLNDQTVVGGRSADLDRLEQDIAENFPRKRAVRLKTEGAFHTYYMVTAAQHFRAVLDQAEFTMGDVKVLCNYTGDYHDSDAASVRTRLFFQLFHPVMWLRNLQTVLNDGAGKIIEFGGGIGKGETPAGKRPNLEGMIKKAQRGSDNATAYFAAINVDSIQDTVAALPL